MTASAGIAESLRKLEELKCTLLASVSSVFDQMRKGDGPASFEALAYLIETAYRLAIRLGADRETLKSRVEERLRL